jgi:D-beta-D-heptose 7-phosphate kinase / D-beta-D-heptose 1-phosphate adenosyltransferase
VTAGIDIVRRFRGLRALVIGDAMLDSYLEGVAARICSEAPVPVIRKTAEDRVPGGAANVAANLAALGAEVILLGVTGDDAAGRLLRTALRDRGIDDSWLIQDACTTTLHKLRILANGQYVVRFDEGGDAGYAPHTYSALHATLDHVYPNCDLVVISDYNYGVITDELVEHVRRLRASDSRVLAVDSKKLTRFREAAATIITPNHLEAQIAAGMSEIAAEANDIPSIMRIGRRLIEATNAEHVAITMGAEGVCVIDRRGRARHLPAHPVPHVSDVGAGDSFLATIALALATGANIRQSTSIAIEASCIAAGKRRTAVVHYQELLQRVSLHEHVAQTSRPEQELASVIAKLDAARSAGKTVVFTNGIFDLVHAGHIEFLNRARELGDLLVVGVNSNRTTRLLKGRNRPINDEQSRLALVKALAPVSHALLFDDEEPSGLIRVLQPDIHVKGGDYAGVDLPEAEAVDEVGGRIVILPLAGNPEARQMIERIAVLAGGEEIGDEL